MKTKHLKDKVFLYKFTCPHCGKEARVEEVTSGLEEVSPVLSVLIGDRGGVFAELSGSPDLRGDDIRESNECSECGHTLDDLATLIEEGHMVLTEEIK